jgi:hypothetical protein
MCFSVIPPALALIKAQFSVGDNTLESWTNPAVSRHNLKARRLDIIKRHGPANIHRRLIEINVFEFLRETFLVE